MRIMLPTPLSLLSSLIHPYIISITITITITVIIETRRREGAREAVNVLSLGWGVKMVGIDTSFDLIMYSSAYHKPP